MNKSMKPSAPKPLTEQEKQNQILRFIAQKRESFASSILFGLVHNIKPAEVPEAVKAAILGADELLKELYPIPAQGENTEK